MRRTSPRQWLWFAALWLTGVAVMASVSGLVRWLL